MTMFRQNAVLNDFVNFLKARGRFREIEFIDNSVHATPRIPDFPSIIFYIEETKEPSYTGRQKVCVWRLDSARRRA